jgi:hypothetical protein
MSGQIFDSLTGKLDKCPRCKGKKEAPCTTCSGSGGQPCALCNGRQRTPCEACGALGSAPCTTCGLTGKLINGLEIEATYKPFTETLELRNSDVPPDVVGKLGSVVNWAKEPLSDAIKARLPKEVVDAAERLKTKIILPPNSRVVLEKASLEKKVYYQVAYSVANIAQVVWVAGSKLAVYSDVNPVLAMHAGILEESQAAIAANRLAEASSLLSKLGAVSSISVEVSRLRSRLRLKLLWPALLGSLVASMIISCAGAPFLMKALAGSLNVHTVIFQAVIADLSVAVVVGLLIFVFGGKPARGLLKRVFASAGITTFVLGALYGSAVLVRYNPARDIDEQQMKAEYAAYFPFGRRTLATDEDIKFLGRLINKYKLADIDLSQQRQDMKWLKDKIMQDKATLAATEKMRQRIVDIDNGKTHLKQSHRYARSHRAKKRPSNELRIK